MRRICQSGLFFESTNSLGADFEADFLAVNNHGLGLQVRLPNFLGLFLRKGNIVPKLFALAGNFTYLHRATLYLFLPLSSINTVSS